MCEVRVGKRSFNTKVELEGEQIVVRGPEGFKLRFEELTQLEVSAGVLSLATPKRAAQFVLGAAAQEWAERARSPIGRLEKLGIKGKARVALLGGIPKDLLEEIQRSGVVIVRGGQVGIVLLAPADRHDLEQLDTLREWIAPSGCVWVIREKGSDTLSERDVRAAAKAAGLVAIKVAKLSERHTADKFVIPSKNR